MGGSETAQAVLAPVNDSLAFLSGTLNRGDSSMRVIQQDGKEKLVIDGFQGYDISLVPPVAIGDVKTGQVDFHKTAWYRFTTDTAGLNTLFAIAGNDPRYRLRLFSESLVQEHKSESGSLKWTSRPGVWYLAISPTPDATGEFTLTVNN